LPDQPECATHREQHPKKISAPVRSSRIQQKTCVREERHNTLRQVSESSQSRASPVQKQRGARIRHKEEQPKTRDANNRFGRGHKIRRIYFRREKRGRRRRIQHPIRKYKRSRKPRSMAGALKTVLSDGGGGGIRTPETLSGLTVFKTAAFNHSATPPH
jgi:hypothetical protein